MRRHHDPQREDRMSPRGLAVLQDGVISQAGLHFAMKPGSTSYRYEAMGPL